MTKRDLLEALASYPDDTPLFDGRGYDLKPSSISERPYDIWSPESEKDVDGYETPTVGVGISIGPRL